MKLKVSKQTHESEKQKRTKSWSKKPRRTRSERFGERKKANMIGFVRYDSHTMGCQLTISSLISGAAFNHSRAAITTCVSRRRWRPRRFLRPKSRSTSPSLSRRDHGCGAERC